MKNKTLWFANFQHWVQRAVFWGIIIVETPQVLTLSSDSHVSIEGTFIVACLWYSDTTDMLALLISVVHI